MNRVLTINLEKCTGCRACELVCSLTKAGEFNPSVSRIKAISHLEEVIHFPLTCLQCEDPPCGGVCPTRAIYKDTEKGVTLVREAACIGCRMCILACPFGHIFRSSDGKIVKCDLCGGEPQCVEFCSSGALQYEEEDSSRTSRLVDFSQKLKEGRMGSEGFPIPIS